MSVASAARAARLTVAAWVWTALMLTTGAAGGLFLGLLTCGAC